MVRILYQTPTMMTEPTILRPKNFSSYQLQTRLGEGLSSQVVSALRRDAGGLSEQLVVLKVLKSETAVSWLQKEFAALGAVDSQYCVRVLGWESFAEGPALVLEHIDGVTLHELGRRFQLDETEIDELAYQVEQGLTDLHSVSVVHGDLSPKNILITSTGDVKLIDFGAAAGSKELIGTPAYLPNARWRGEVASCATDFSSWTLIATDLRSRFDFVPSTTDLAQLRAAKFADVTDLPVRTETIAIDRTSLGHKVRVVQNERAQTTGSTTVLNMSSSVTSSVSLDASEPFVPKSWRSRSKLLAAVLLLAISTPVFSTPEPTHAAPGALRVSTMKWVEVSVDQGEKRYAPFFVKIGAGRHQLQWRSQRGSGEFEMVIPANQVRTLSDPNFRH